MKTGTLLAIILFCLVAIAHLLRILMGWEATVNAWVVPMWISVLGFLVPGALAFLLWREAH